MKSNGSYYGSTDCEDEEDVKLMGTGEDEELDPNPSTSSGHRVAFSLIIFSVAAFILGGAAIVVYGIRKGANATVTTTSSSSSSIATTGIFATIPSATKAQSQPIASYSDIPFPIVDRSQYNDSASKIMNISLFHPSLVYNKAVDFVNTTGVRSEMNGSVVEPCLRVPFPTGAFWTNLVMPAAAQGLSYPVVAYPYSFKWNYTYVQVSYSSSMIFTNDITVQDIFQPHITLESPETIDNRHVMRYDPLSVTTRFGASNGGGWEQHMVHGSPYVTLTYNQTTPSFRAMSVFLALDCPTTTTQWGTCSKGTATWAEPLLNVTSQYFVATTAFNMTMLIFASEPIKLTFNIVTRTHIIADAPFTGTIRFALVPEGGALNERPHFPSNSTGMARLVQHANTYPTGCKVDWSVSPNDKGTVQFAFQTAKLNPNIPTTELLMLGLPHHAQVLPASSILGRTEFDIDYYCIKGQMIPVVGSTWTYQEPLTTVGLEVDEDMPLNSDLQILLLGNLQQDLKISLPAAGLGVYPLGKQLARLAQLAHIAHVVHRNSLTSGASEVQTTATALLTEATSKLHNFLTMVFDGQNKDKLLYDGNFGGVVSKEGLQNVQADFGNGRYNDHHFHYGYYLYASAIMGYLNSTFITEYGDFVDNLMFDVVHKTNRYSSDVGNHFFPFARHKSWYDSHSFASGLFPFATGKSQESSSEAVNCYFGAYLWSRMKFRALKDATAQEYSDFARILLAMEIRGAQTYWHMTPALDAANKTSPQVYLPSFTQNIMVGNVGMLDAVCSTWFGAQKLYVHMINFLPATAITSELFDPSFVQVEYPKLMSQVQLPVNPTWDGYVVCDHSLIDPVAAWTEALSLESSKLDSGISKTQILNFVSRQQDGLVAKSYNSTVAVPGNSPLSPHSCAANPSCVKIGLTGQCCPTSSGAHLGCCTPPKACDANPGCKKLGLLGMCCPTPAGVNLGCCGW